MRSRSYARKTHSSDCRETSLHNKITSACGKEHVLLPKEKGHADCYQQHIKTCFAKFSIPQELTKINNI